MANILLGPAATGAKVEPKPGIPAARSATGDSETTQPKPAAAANKPAGDAKKPPQHAFTKLDDDEEDVDAVPEKKTKAPAKDKTQKTTTETLTKTKVQGAKTEPNKDPKTDPKEKKAAGNKGAEKPSEKSAMKKPGEKPTERKPAAGSASAGTSLGTAGSSLTNITQASETTEPGHDNVLLQSEAWQAPSVDFEQQAADRAAAEEVYSNNFILGVKTFQYFVKIFYRFPYGFRKLPDGKVEFFWDKHQGRGFLATSIILLLASIWFIANLMSLFLNVPRHTKKSLWDTKLQAAGAPKNIHETSGWGSRAEEMFVFYRNICVIMIYLSMCYHIVIANWRYYFNRAENIAYLTFTAK
jgi:hypothetical protein